MSNMYSVCKHSKLIVLAQHCTALHAKNYVDLKKLFGLPILNVIFTATSIIFSSFESEKGDKDWQNRKPFQFLLTVEVTDMSSHSH
jgi:hypothetical protein